jgi:hypothetical protein
MTAPAGCDGRYDQRKAAAEIVPITSNETHTIHFSLSDDPKAIVLDFVNPAAASRRMLGRRRQAGFVAGQGPLGAYSAPQLTRY